MDELPDGARTITAALYFPRVMQVDPNRQGRLDTFAPSGAVAGVMARTDARRGVWKAPAGLEATLDGIDLLELDDERTRPASAERSRPGGSRGPGRCRPAGQTPS